MKKCDQTCRDKHIFQHTPVFKPTQTSPSEHYCDSSTSRLLAFSTRCHAGLAVVLEKVQPVWHIQHDNERLKLVPFDIPPKRLPTPIVLVPTQLLLVQCSGVGATTNRFESLRKRPTPMHGGLSR